MIDPQSLYLEFKNDPTNIGYKVGNGVSFEDKQNEINLERVNIQVTRVAQDTVVDPGEVAEPIPVQLIRDAIDVGEYDDNCITGANPDATKSGIRDLITLLIGGSPGDSLLAFTLHLKAQILAIFTNPNWSQTRQNLIEIQNRDGSRAEQLYGGPPAPVTRSDMLAAEQWGQQNGQPTLYE